MIRDAAKNRSRAPIRPLDLPTLALTSGGLGFLRPAPGTWGSLPPVAVLGLMALGGGAPEAMWLVCAGILVLSCVVCVIWGRYAETRFGRKDAAEVVIDETAGVSITAFAALAGTPAWSAPGSGTFRDTIPILAALAAAFVLFRLADIIKPWPARQLERLPHGWGVLLDDLAAGVYAALVLAAGLWLIHRG